jgi:hypothetical protein
LEKEEEKTMIGIEDSIFLQTCFKTIVELPSTFLKLAETKIKYIFMTWYLTNLVKTINLKKKSAIPFRIFQDFDNKH